MSEGFPWRSHRTFAEVLETEELRRLFDAAGLSDLSWRRLETLEVLERANNPEV